MEDYTLALSQALDAKRNVFHGTSATLSLLDYARPGFKGYDVLVQVLSGWHLDSGKDIGEAMLLEVAESVTVTREILDKAIGFGIYIPSISDPAKVWVLAGEEDNRKAPTHPSKKKWVFTVIATQEPFEK